MIESTTTPTKHVTFSDKPEDHEADCTFDEDDIEIMFYTNAEVNSILEECKKEDDLPLFWAPLRIHRIELLWDEVDREQHYQRNKISKEQAAKRDLLEDLARSSRKISQHHQKVAVQEAKKLAEEVRKLMSSTSDVELQRQVLASSIHKSLSQKGDELASSRRLSTAGLQGVSSNSLAARQA
ncbi:MAG: hypothetical protein SGBAC_003140 [Bacillariaceae sp.]